MILCATVIDKLVGTIDPCLRSLAHASESEELRAQMEELDAKFEKLPDVKRYVGLCYHMHIRSLMSRD